MIVGISLLHGEVANSFDSLLKKHCADSYGSTIGPNGNKVYRFRSSKVNVDSCTLIIASCGARCRTSKHALSPPSPFQPSFLATRCVQSLTGDTAHGAYAVPDIIIALWNKPLDMSEIICNETDAEPALSPNNAAKKKNTKKRIAQNINWLHKHTHNIRSVHFGFTNYWYFLDRRRNADNSL